MWVSLLQASAPYFTPLCGCHLGLVYTMILAGLAASKFGKTAETACQVSHACAMHASCICTLELQAACFPGEEACANNIVHSTFACLAWCQAQIVQDISAETHDPMSLLLCRSLIQRLGTYCLPGCEPCLPAPVTWSWSQLFLWFTLR